MVIRYFITGVMMMAMLGVRSQSLDFANVERLTSMVNSEAEESLPLLAPDGQRLFFARILYDGNTGGNYGGHDVWASDFSSAGWKRADNSRFSFNNRGNNAIVGVHRDGKTIYLLDASPSRKLNGIYFSKLISNYWTRPELIPIPGINNQDFVGFFVSPDFDVIFLSMKAPDSRGDEDIYITVKDATGNWSAPKNLGATINTTGFEISPFLSADKKRLYFASNGHGGQGDSDIFYSERLYNSWETWSVPVNLGDKINSKKFDAYFSIYGDSIAYFSSNRESLLSDLYTAKVSRGTDILAKGQRYLSMDEVDEALGKNILRKLTFEKKAAEISPAQKELLYYIANKLLLKKELGIHLIVREEESPDLTKARLASMYEYLKNNGIDGTRIYTDQKPGAVKTGSKNGMIEIMLFR